MHATPTPSRPRGTRIVATAVVGGFLSAGLVLAAPLAASAHVGVSPDAAAAGASSVLTFAFNHGCGESPTTALVFDIPDGVQSVYPTLAPGWTITTEQGANGSVSQVTYTADEPVPGGIRATVDMSVRFTEETANTSVAFPVTQRCVEGETAWAEIAADGVDPHSLESPAPVVAVGAVSSEDEHGGHGDAESADDETSEQGSAEHETAGHETTTDAGGSPLSIVLSAIGLGASIVALVLAVFALRRTRA